MCITKFYQYQLSKYKAVNNRVVRGVQQKTDCFSKSTFHKGLHHALENLSVFIMAIFLHASMSQV